MLKTIIFKHKAGVFQPLHRILFIVFIFAFSIANAGTVKMIASRSGANSLSPIIKTYPAITMQLADQEYSYMLTHPISSGTPWTNVFNVPFIGSSTDRQAYTNVVLRYDESKAHLHSSPWEIKIEYVLKTWDGVSSTPTTHSTESLTIGYDPAAPYKDKAINRYPNSFYSEIYITAVYVNSVLQTTALSSIYNDVYLDLEQETTRYYVLGSTAPDVESNYISATNELELNWNFVPGAENYDVEWLFIDIDNDNTSLPNLNSYNTSFDFHNATRVNVTDQHYKIPLSFPRGVLLYRVRPVAADPDDFTLRKEGTWSFMPGAWSGTLTTDAPITTGYENYRRDIDLATVAAVDPLVISAFHTDLNWQYSAVYAEDGKRKESISFFDGSLHSRQSVTLNNTEQTALVAETKYDYTGRPAVQILPSPVASEGIKYYNNFNPNFDRSLFDQDANVDNPAALSTSSGSGYFYSTANTSPIGFNGSYIPDAEGYAYSRIRYATDGTDRPVSISSPGAELKTSSGHETKFFYGSPSSQDELDRLFGSEVGNHKHYQKNMTQDPNGQVTVAYLDQEGRTIATALAGATPDNLIAIDHQPEPETVIENVLEGSNEIIGNTMTSSFDVICTADGTLYTFDYTLGSDTSCSGCFVCKDCVYDLKIAVYDLYGNYVPGATIITSTCPDAVTGNPVTCNAISDGTYSFSVTLPVGSFKVVKTLKLNNAALLEYETEFAEYQHENFTCPTVVPIHPSSCDFSCESICEQQHKHYDAAGNAHYYDDSGSEVSETDGLALIASCIADNCSQTQQPIDECSVKLTLLSEDMSPYGQYFDNLPYKYDLDVNGNLVNNASYDIDNWLETNVWANSNSSAWTNANFVGPSGVITSWADLRTYWDDAFLTQAFASSFSGKNSLLEFHPEYCAYNYFCEHTICSKESVDISVEASNQFDGYLGTVSEADAVTNNYFNLMGLSSSSTYNLSTDLTAGNESYQPYSSTVTDIYFDCNPIDPNCGTTPAADIIEDHLRKFYPIPSTSPQKYLSIWYVMDDPGGIHTGSGTVDPTTRAFFQTLHGNGSTSGLLADLNVAPAAGQVSQWDFYRGVYEFYKGLVIYDTYYGNTSCGFLTDADQDGYTEITGTDPRPHAFQIRYPENPIYQVFTDNASTMICAVDPSQYSTFETFTTDASITSCKSACEGYANLWIQQLNAACTLTPTQQADISEYLVKVCQLDCDGTSQEGSSGCSTCPTTPCSPATTCTGVPLASNPSIVFYDFEDVINYFTSGGCTATIVHPLTGDEANCSCQKLTDFIEANFPSSTPTNTEIADALNSSMNLAPGYYTSSDVAAWKSECANAVPSNTTLATLNYPEGLKCISPENVTVTYAAGKCECENITQFININGFDASVSTDIPLIVDALNAYLNPATAITSTDLNNWLTECANASPSNATLVADNLPSVLQCPLPASSSTIAVAAASQQAACLQNSLTTALWNAVSQHDQQLHQHIVDYDSYMRTNCLNNLAGRETFLMTHDQNEYLYTLYYYDQAGNLVKTVPPKGVVFADAGEITQVQNYRDHPEDPLHTPFFPPHTMVTRYKYNSLQQMTESETPDGGITKFWYDELGRMILSQNARQAQYNNPPYSLGGDGYSYMLYDDLGRVTESGELIHPTSTPMDYATSRDATARATWMAANTLYREITYTFYDAENLSADATTAYGSGWQENLRNRISAVWYVKDAAAFAASGRPDDAQYYSYDIHGNVKTLVTESNIKDRLHYLGVNLKRTDYTYDLISGNVNAVNYQPGEHDEFNHRYYYDADNRLTDAYSSHDGVIWEKEAKYFYYANGPLARTEIGDREVQGTDYAITIQGWIKGINSNTLEASRDIGKDGDTPNTNLNRWFGVDGAAYSLGYFTNDYKAIDASLNNSTTGFLASETNATNNYKSNCVDLFNGNISRMVTSIRDENGTPIPVMGRTFRYDQLNRIKESSSYTDAGLITNNQWGALATSGGYHYEAFTYDMNGNIETVQRNGNLSGTNLQMDDMTYHYVSGKNKLNYVDDASSSSHYTDDIDAQSSGNYDYDAIGNLIKDDDEDIGLITWNNQGKIVTVERTGSTTKSDLEFLYNALGQRTCKIEKPRISTVLQDEDKWIYTIYSRDAQGNVLATYKMTYNTPGTGWQVSYDLQEQDIYAASRIGIHYDQQAAVTRNFTGSTGTDGMFDYTAVTFTNATQFPAVSSTFFERELGDKAYELSNHLGNVLETVSDRRIPLAETTSLNTAPFTSGAYGWSTTNATVSGLRLKVTAVSTTTGTDQTFTTVAGTYYSLTFDVDVNTLGVDVNVKDVTTSAILANLTDLSIDGTYSVGFVATGTNTKVSFTANAIAGPPVSNNIFYLDNIYVGNTSMVLNYRPEVRNYSDYYVFGAPMEGRTYVDANGKYRYGFNGCENDNEIHGNNGDSYTTDYRAYDARLGKWLSIDPVVKPWESPFAGLNNNPILLSDPFGSDPGDPPGIKHQGGITGNEQAAQGGTANLPANASNVWTYTTSSTTNPNSGNTYSVVPGSVAAYKLNGEWQIATFNPSTKKFIDYEPEQPVLMKSEFTQKEIPVLASACGNSYGHLPTQDELCGHLLENVPNAWGNWGQTYGKGLNEFADFGEKFVYGSAAVIATGGVALEFAPAIAGEANLIATYGGPTLYSYATTVTGAATVGLGYRFSAAGADLALQMASGNEINRTSVISQFIFPNPFVSNGIGSTFEYNSTGLHSPFVGNKPILKCAFQTSLYGVTGHAADLSRNAFGCGTFFFNYEYGTQAVMLEKKLEPEK
jgi:RHS repeat-associated protein